MAKYAYPSPRVKTLAGRSDYGGFALWRSLPAQAVLGLAYDGDTLLNNIPLGWLGDGGWAGLWKDIYTDS